MRFNIVIFFFGLIFFSCEEQFGDDPGELPQKIVNSSNELFSGNIIDQSSYIFDGVDVWKIKIENESGSVVSFYWQKGYNLLFMIEGERGPFNYDLMLPLGVIMLSTAKFLAFESYSDEVLFSWKLIRKKSYKNRWIFQFYLNKTESHIMIDGVSGDLL